VPNTASFSLKPWLPGCRSHAIGGVFFILLPAAFQHSTRLYGLDAKWPFPKKVATVCPRSCQDVRAAVGQHHSGAPASRKRQTRSLAEQKVHDDFCQAVAEFIGISRLAEGNSGPKFLDILRIPKGQVAVLKSWSRIAVPDRDRPVKHDRQTFIQPQRKGKMDDAVVRQLVNQRSAKVSSVPVGYRDMNVILVDEAAPLAG